MKPHTYLLAMVTCLLIATVTMAQQTNPADKKTSGDKPQIGIGNKGPDPQGGGGGGSLYIDNQYAAAQSASFWIDGIGQSYRFIATGAYYAVDGFGNTGTLNTDANGFAINFNSTFSGSGPVTRFNTTGVGIGTVPAAQFHTTGSVRFAGLGNDNTQTRVVVSDASGNLAWRDASTLGGGGGSSQWTTSGSDIYYNTGNVGIGTGTPATKLHVSGAVRVTGTSSNQVEFTGNNPYNPGFIFDGAQSKTTMYLMTSQNLSTGTGGGTLFNGSFVQLYNNAQLSAYQQPLTIMRSWPGLATTSGIVIDNDQQGTVPSASNYKIISAKFSGVEVAAINGTGGGYFAGNIAIGSVTTFPSGYKLAVAGNIISEKVRVKLQSTGWPDYVFNDEYLLPSLKETEQFIKQNNHLPGVPSAAQIEKEGLDLGDGQAVLLKKIEELTLHLIEMDKKIEKLSAENERLKKKLQ